MPAASRRTILHVTECYGGGVESMLRRYASVAPDARHVLLWNARRTADPGDPAATGLFDELIAMPEGHAGAVRAVRRAVRDVRPDLVHAHSSFAGAYARLALGWDPRTRGLVAYTPHGLIIEDSGRPLPKRLVFLGAEAVLSLLGGTFAGCSPREDRLLGRINPFPRRRPIPNGLVAGEVPDLEWEPGKPPEVGIAARIDAVRRPDVFADVARRVRAEHPDVRFTWIGDGPADLRALLEDAGVEVTGWAPKEEVLRRMSGLSAYLHCAAQDGFPVAVLEAFAVGVPVLVPSIAAFADCPGEVRYDGAAEAARRTLGVLDHPGEVLRAWDPIRRRHSPEAFAHAVRALYALDGEVEA
ncbi:glycosyltransferase family 4 protein [Corynebacterium sp. 335C]